jgi:hypothetical protein
MAALSQMTTSVLVLGDLEVVIWLHTAKDPTDAEWDVSHAEMVAALKQGKGNIERRVGLVVSDGGSPSTRMRGMVLADVWTKGGDKSTRPLAVFTPELNNPVKRGIATALSWIQPQLRFLRPRDWAIGLAHVGLSDHETEVLAELARMQARVFPVVTLSRLGPAAHGKSA